MKLDSQRLLVTLLRWPARALLVGVFLLWGALFIEHTQEWFVVPWPQRPPLRVCAGHALHFLLLMGLLATLRWARVGAAWAGVAAFAFFLGRSGSQFGVFFALTVLPALLLVWCDWLDRRRVNRVEADHSAN
jgi:hypothetical protein